MMGLMLIIVAFISLIVITWQELDRKRLHTAIDLWEQMATDECTRAEAAERGLKLEGDAIIWLAISLANTTNAAYDDDYTPEYFILKAREAAREATREEK